MSLSRRFFTVAHRVIGQSTGSSRHDYMSDGLGSIVAVADSTGSVVSTYRAKPYGSTLSQSGLSPSTRFAWVGSAGYDRVTSRKYADVYVRSRFYANLLASWCSVDRFWPREPAYTYAKCNPITVSDPTGLAPCSPAPNCCESMNWTEFGHCPGGTWVDCPSSTSLAQRCQFALTPPSSINCDEVKKTINAVAETCVTFCDGGSYPPGARWDAATRCCRDTDGTPRGCIKCCSTFVGEITDGWSACRAYCLLGHEFHHARDCETGSVPKNSECCAFYSQMRCLFQIAYRACNWISGGQPDPGYTGKAFGECQKKARARGCAGA
jgi:RHS repeat-associated protein